MRCPTWWVLVMLAACGGDAPDELTVTIDTGVLHGGVASGVRHFLGVPYAAPPVGANRWRVPQPLAPWSGTREALDTGTQCAQSLGFTGSSTEEDCLFLNVWTPSGAHGLPVMVWLHGGAFLFGSGGEKYYAGEHLASRGYVIVTVNYRLGAIGFMAHPALDADDPAYPTSGNYGFEDQRAALEWVQRNIKAFGGDPTKVTLFGESAGGFSACVQYLSPRAQGLFTSAISESGLCGTSIVEPSHADAQMAGVAAATKLGCTSGDIVACLRGKSAADIIAATDIPPTSMQLPGGPFYLAGKAFPFLPNVDGYVLAKPMRQAFAEGNYDPRPLLLGTNRDEGTLLHSTLLASQVMTDQEYRDALARRFGMSNVAAIVAKYPSSAFPSPNRALAEVTTDALFVCPARATARGASKHATVYRYSFEHPPESAILPDLGVFHSAELPFVFGNDNFPLGQVGASGAALADTVQTYWTHFASTGEPDASWPAYDATDPHLVLDTQISTGTALKAALCDFWDALPPG